MSDVSDQESSSLIRGGDDRDGYVFISYKREEAAQAEHLRTVLIENGFDVWWDEDIQCGQVWNQVLDDAVKNAGCIVVLWSSRSMQSRWVMHEASSAIDREVYAPVRIELCSIPPPYNRIQATDLLEWDGDSDHPGVRDLLTLVSSLLPLRKSLPVRIREALWGNRTTFLAVLFACVALGILVWQTIATRSQLRQMDEIVSQQAESSNQLDRFQQQSASSVQSQLSQLAELESQQNSIIVEQKAQALTKTIVKELRVTWKFDEIPPWTNDLMNLTGAALDTRLYQDEYADLGVGDNRMINAAIRIDDGLKPALVALARGDDDISKLFGGDIDRALESTFDMDEGSVEYVGPSVEFLFPLTADKTKTLLLETESGFDYVAFDRLVADLDDDPKFNYDPSFTADISVGDALTFTWVLDLTKGNSDHTNTTGNLPPVFELIAFHDVPATIRNSESEDVWERRDRELKDSVRPWSRESSLRIVVNGIENLALDYLVTNLGVFEVSYDYDNPRINPLDGDTFEREEQYERPQPYKYTKFRCER